DHGWTVQTDGSREGQRRKNSAVGDVRQPDGIDQRKRRARQRRHHLRSGHHLREVPAMIRARTAAIAALIVIALASPAAAQGGPTKTADQDANSLSGEGDRQMADGDYTGAGATYTKVVETQSE